ncbi:MAG: hypothetical protein ACHP65_04420 [Legionellales bacterium]
MQPFSPTPATFLFPEMAALKQAVPDVCLRAPLSPNKLIPSTSNNYRLQLQKRYAQGASSEAPVAYGNQFAIVPVLKQFPKRAPSS